MAPLTPLEPGRGADLDPGQDAASHAAGVGQGIEQRRGAFAYAWSTVSAVVGTLMGLVPHVMHHVGLLAGTALVTGTGGNLAFGVLGLVFSIPLLRRLYRRFNTWRAPAIALAVFAVMFSLSAFVIGPAISGGSPADAPAPSQELPTGDSSHHG